LLNGHFLFYAENNYTQGGQICLNTLQLQHTML